MSYLRRLDRKDILNGLFMAILAVVMSGLLDVLLVMKDGSAFTLHQLSLILISWWIAWLTYLIKRLFSGNTGIILSNKPAT